MSQYVGGLMFGGLWLAVALVIYGLLAAISYRPARWRKPLWKGKVSLLEKLGKKVLDQLAGNAEKLEAKRLLLRQCGLAVPVRLYVLLRRAFVVGLVGWLWLSASFGFLGMAIRFVWLSYAACAVLLLLVLIDDILLQGIAIRRRNGITAEIYQTCRQLLYYQDSKLSLHSKLARCQACTKLLRTPFRRLLNEWYGHPERALRTFKESVSVGEAYSFAETLNAMRLHDHERYYELLEERAADYKEKLELVKQSASETRSYVLFIMAGIPILNTFRLFLYPWIREGEQLFQFLNQN